MTPESVNHWDATTSVPPHWRHITITAACAGAHKGMPVHPDDPKGVPPGLRLPATLRCAHASGTVPRPGTRMRAQATSQVTSGAPMTTEVPPNHTPSNDGRFGCPAHTKACPHEKKGTPPTTCRAATSTPPTPTSRPSHTEDSPGAFGCAPPFRNPAVPAQSQPRICPDTPHPQVHTWSRRTPHV